MEKFHAGFDRFRFDAGLCGVIDTAGEIAVGVCGYLWNEFFD
jgi:hypothetical protein